MLVMRRDTSARTAPLVLLLAALAVRLPRLAIAATNQVTSHVTARLTVVSKVPNVTSVARLAISLATVLLVVLQVPLVLKVAAVAIKAALEASAVVVLAVAMVVDRVDSAAVEVNPDRLSATPAADMDT